MQLFDINSNVFQNTLTNEYEQFKKDVKNNSSAKEDVRNYVDGNILFSIPQQSGAFGKLITDEWNVTTHENRNAASNFNTSEIYHIDVTQSIIKSSESYKFYDAIQQVGEIVEALGDKLAGILLVSGKTIINPLHPLTALILIDERENLTFEEFKIITYLYNDREYMESFYNSEYTDDEKVRKNILSLISLYSNKQQTNEKSDILEIEQTSGVLSDVRTFYKKSVYEGNEYEGDFVVVPVQLLTKGIVAPYYGTAIILREDTTAKGVSVSPLWAVNVSKKFTDDYTPEFSGICTGNTPRTTLDGLRTLSHANLSSPLTSFSMGDGSIPYIDECIKQSINLYTLGGFFTTTVEDTADEQEAELTEHDLEDEKNFTDEEVAEYQATAHDQSAEEAIQPFTREFMLPITRTTTDVNFVTTTDTTGVFQTTTGEQIETGTQTTGTRFIHPDFDIEAIAAEQEEINNHLEETEQQQAIPPIVLEDETPTEQARTEQAEQTIDEILETTEAETTDI